MAVVSNRRLAVAEKSRDRELAPTGRGQGWKRRSRDSEIPPTRALNILKKALTWSWRIGKMHKETTLCVTVLEKIDGSPDEPRSDCPLAR